jgi:tetratricopeptide (TPR) repeat protein
MKSEGNVAVPLATKLELLYLMQNNKAEAVRLADELCEKFAYDSFVQCLSAEVMLQTSEDHDVLYKFDNALKYHNGTNSISRYELYSRKALYLLQKNRFSESLENINIAISFIAEDLNAPPAWFARDPYKYKSLALMSMGRLEEALECIEIGMKKVLIVEYSHYYTKAQILIQLERYPEALNDSMTAVGLDPGNFNVSRQLGTILIKLERFKEAIRIMEPLADKAKDFYFFSELGKCYERVRDHEKMLWCCYKALDIDPNDEATLKKKAMLEMIF